jgi:hypothetical protein
MPVGDVNSTEKGSAARYNDNKAPIDLLDLGFVAAMYGFEPIAKHDPYSGMWHHIAEFQAGGEQVHLLEAAANLMEDAAVTPREFYAGVARVLDYGRRKYAAWNWAKGQPWSVVIGSLCRHVLLSRSEYDDEESGLPHWAHAGCNLMFLFSFHRLYPEGDDRPIELKEAS